MAEDTTTTITSDSNLLSKVVVNGAAAGDFAGDLKVTKVTNPSGGAGFGTAKGQYQVTVASNDAANVTGSAVIKYCILDNDVADSVVYGRTTLSDGQTLTIDLSYGDVFNTSNIAAKDAFGNTYKGDQPEITYTDLDNNETVDASVLGTVGSYKPTIRVKPTQGFATNDWFAKALAWAKAFGVANSSNGEFRPYDDITREEFASLLANYAKAMGKFEAADDSALDSAFDANTVSAWAKDNVAWAVANKVMGNGGFVAGQSNITRAEVAAMAVNYQPENLTGETR